MPLIRVEMMVGKDVTEFVDVTVLYLLINHRETTPSSRMTQPITRKPRTLLSSSSELHVS
jgi:hypothetical protein